MPSWLSNLSGSILEHYVIRKLANHCSVYFTLRDRHCNYAGVSVCYGDDEDCNFSNGNGGLECGGEVGDFSFDDGGAV